MKKHATLPPDAIALFSFLLGVANGRTQFTASITDLRKMTSRLSHDRFLELVRRLQTEGLIELAWSSRRVERDWRSKERDEDPDLWTIKQRPPWQPPKLGRDGEKFLMPVAQKMQLVPVAATKRERRSPERQAYKNAKANCDSRGVEFPYRDFTEFMHDVGERPPGNFSGSGRSTHALFRRGDGKYQWRLKGDPR